MNVQDFLGEASSHALASISTALSDDLCSEDLTLTSVSVTDFSEDEDITLGDYTIGFVPFGTREGYLHNRLPIEEENRDVAEPCPVQKQKYHSKSEALRLKRAEDVRSAFSDPAMWRYLDKLQIECVGASDYFDTGLPSMVLHRDDAWQLFEREEKKENDVMVTVEVSTVTIFVLLFPVLLFTDCCKQATAICEYDIQKSGAQMVPGSNAVGVVHHCSPSAEEAGVKPGMRLAAILQPGGSNARYFSMPASEVLPVPRHLDAADIASVMTSYLPAFQALHHGRVRPYRYSRNCLDGRRVFIVGGAQVVAQAAFRLAQFAGAAEIYVSAPLQVMAHLRKQGAIVFGEHPNEWFEYTEKSMDVVIDFQFPNHFSEVRKTLARKGRLVCCTPSNWNKDNAWWSDLSHMLECLQVSSVKRATLFDFRENYKNYRYELKEDLQFLLTALNRRHIRPDIDRYVKLADLPDLHRELERTPATGSIICEPWRD
jgi:NADPH:quinone reductase-like Zn-dependent oxidoreductase